MSAPANEAGARHHLYLLDRTYQALSAPSDHPSQPASGAATRPIGSGVADADREGADVHFLDNRRHSVHVDFYACDPDESGGLAS